MSGLQLTNCGYEKCSQGHFFGPAVRDHLLIHYVVSGMGLYQRGDNTYTVQKGQIFIILPNEVTYYEANRDNPWEYYWLGVAGSDLKEYMYDLNISEDKLVIDLLIESKEKEKQQAEILEIFRKLLKYFTTANANPYSIMAYLNMFFAKIADIQAGHSLTGTDVLCQRAVQYFKNNYSYDIRIEELCKMLGVSRGHFFRIFKSYAGMSPQNYLIKTRIDAACRLLEKSELGITEIGCSSGFKDSAHFSRLFKLHAGCAPKEYRKKEKRKNI